MVYPLNDMTSLMWRTLAELMRYEYNGSCRRYPKPNDAVFRALKWRKLIEVKGTYRDSGMTRDRTLYALTREGKVAGFAFRQGSHRGL